jgi:glycosyltransferase involved in cell wall biosynthesis
MSAPKLSIVIPTRERAVTLRHTLRTLIDQSYSSCEIIVCDNASTDNTRDVVESFFDSRIRYINPGRRVSMSENWEFALWNTKGE